VTHCSASDSFKIFIVLSSTSPAICESSLWFLWAKVGQRQVAANSLARLQTWPLSPPVGCYRPNAHWCSVLLLNHKVDTHLPFLGGWRPSRPRHCSKCAAVPKTPCRNDFRENNKLMSAARFEPEISRVACKRATTRPMQPAFIYSYLYVSNQFRRKPVFLCRALYYCRACHGNVDDIKVVKKCRCRSSKICSILAVICHSRMPTIGVN